MNKLNKHQKIKLTLRIIGILFLVIGLSFLIFGLVDFFQAFGTMDAPKHFWALFVGTGCLPVGIGCTIFGFHKEIARYTQDEILETQIKQMVAIQKTLHHGAKAYEEGKAEAQKCVCPKCGAENSIDDKFCKECGSPINEIVCPHCGQLTDSDSTFCQNCGKKIK